MSVIIIIIIIIIIALAFMTTKHVVGILFRL